jgi:hypothetical protein
LSGRTNLVPVAASRMCGVAHPRVPFRTRKSANLAARRGIALPNGPVLQWYESCFTAAHVSDTPSEQGE